MNACIDNLRREHANMRSVLVIIAHELEKLEHMGAADYVLLANALYYMRKFPGHVHHPKEDLIFRRLAEVDPAWKHEVDALLEQHHEIYELEDELIEAALDCPRVDTDAGRRLLERGRHYLQLQRSHSEIEERALFPQALAMLKPKDWTAFDSRIRTVEDPLFGKHGGERYRLLYEYIMQESQDF